LNERDDEGRRRRRLFWIFIGGPLLALYAVKAATLIWRTWR